MSDTIGIGVLKTVVDNTGMAPGIAAGVRDLKKFEDAADKTGAKVESALGGLGQTTDNLQKSTTRMDATSRRFLASLEREGEQSGRLRSEYLALRAAKLGVSTEAEKYLSRVRAAEQATAKMGMTAKATSAALRGVPAQFTDIVVSLQGGQAPLTVLLQQGGQMKDMFGGAGAAARALLGYVAGLVSPFTVIAAAVGVLGLAYYQSSKETNAFNKELIMSGNFAGTTAGQLQDMAAGFRAMGTTQGAASEMLAKVAGSGKVAKTELELVTQAALNLTKIGGQDMGEAIANFTKLGEDPVKASQKLNESYNYLTQATYEKIKALAESNRQDEASALAQTTFANAVNERANQVKQSLGYIERAFASATNFAKMAWDTILGVGRDTTLSDKLSDVGAKIEQRLKESWKFGGDSGSDPGLKKLREYQAALQEQARLEQRSAEKQAQSARDNKRAIEATDAVSKMQQQAKGVDATTEALKKYRAQLEDIRKTNPTSELLDPAKIKAGEDAIRKATQGPQSRTKAYQDDEATRYLLTLKEQGAALAAQLESEDKLTAATRERVKFEELIAELKSKKTLTADQKSLVANEASLMTQLRKNEATEAEVKTKNAVAQAAKEAAAAEKQAYDIFMSRIKNNTLTMGSRQEGRSEEYGRNLGAFGMGDRARQQIEAQRSIYREYQRYELELRKSTPDSQLGSEKYQDAVTEIQTNLATALAAHKSYYDEIRVLESDASLGQQQAIQNYIDSAANVAQGTAQMWTSGMAQAEDALVNFVATGKLSFKSLANSIISDMIRIQARQAMSGLLSSLFGAAMGAFGGWSGAGMQASGAITTPVYSGSAMTTTSLPPMADGGFTGYGGKYDPAGIVHRGEVVFSQDDVSRHGGVASVEALRKRGGRGFASGGTPGGSSSGFAGGGNIIIQNMGPPLESTGKEEKQNSSGGMDMMVMVRSLEGQMASNIQQGTGPMVKAIEGRFGSKTATR